MRVIFLIGLFILGNTTVFADSELDKQVKNSRLAISAFECSFLTDNIKEQERLFQLGLNAGRDFLEFIQTNSPGEYDDVFFKEKIPSFWLVTEGATTDFVLGRIYEERKNKINKALPRDKELRKLRKEKLYYKKNCALVGK